MTSKFCTKCGVQIIQGKKFCRKCGEPIPQRGSQPSTDACPSSALTVSAATRTETEPKFTATRELDDRPQQGANVYAAATCHETEALSRRMFWLRLAPLVCAAVVAVSVASTAITWLVMRHSKGSSAPTVGVEQQGASLGPAKREPEKLSAAISEAEAVASTPVQYTNQDSPQSSSAVADPPPVVANDALVPESEKPSDAAPEVSIALTRWASAEESNDPAQQAECYAQHIDRFFLAENVSNGFVLQYMTGWLQTHRRRVLTFRLTITSIQNELDGTVKVELIKHVVTQDDQGTSERFTRSVLHLEREGGAWKISSERDFKG